MMMPHAPSILIGASRYGAWTSTTGVTDNMDTYIEVLNPVNQYQYWHNGEWVDMEVRVERFYGPKKMFYEDRNVYRTVHGPIIGWDLDNNLCFTMKTPYYKRELAAEEGWSLFQQAKNIKDFDFACKRVEAAHNFYWAYKKGNI
jgi:penicillin amidase